MALERTRIGISLLDSLLDIVHRAPALIFVVKFVAAFLLVARGHIRQTLQVATQKIWRSFQNCSKMLLHFGTRQRRNANATQRKDSSGSSEQSDDGPTVWSGAGYAFG